MVKRLGTLVGILAVGFLAVSFILFSVGITDTFGLGFALTRGEGNCASVSER